MRGFGGFSNSRGPISSDFFSKNALKKSLKNDFSQISLDQGGKY